jgi:hypothetical protein
VLELDVKRTARGCCDDAGSLKVLDVLDNVCGRGVAEVLPWDAERVEPELDLGER